MKMLKQSTCRPTGLSSGFTEQLTHSAAFSTTIIPPLLDQIFQHMLHFKLDPETTVIHGTSRVLVPEAKHMLNELLRSAPTIKKAPEGPSAPW